MSNAEGVAKKSAGFMDKAKGLLNKPIAGSGGIGGAIKKATSDVVKDEDKKGTSNFEQTNPKFEKNKTLIYVGIGLAVLLVGAFAYKHFKKKK